MIGDMRVPCSLSFRPSQRDSIDVHGNFGRQHQVAAVSCTRVLTQQDTGTLTMTYSPNGLGLQTGLARQLYESLRGEVLWVLGPEEEAGVTFSITHTKERFSVTGKLQVRYSWCRSLGGSSNLIWSS
jgi:hypothetical protein